MSCVLPLPAILLLLAARCAFSQVVISEFMAVNNTTYPDEDGEYTDWIEVHNAGATAVDLEGWYLTDTADNLRNWRFPSTDLGPGGFLIVFASNKDRAVPGEELHTDFKLGGDGEYLALVEPDGLTIASEYAPEYPPQAVDVSYGLTPAVNATGLVTSGAVCRYRVPQDDSLGSTWTAVAFDDGSWSAGATALGFDSGSTWQPYVVTDVGRPMAGRSSIYMRVPFQVNAVSSVYSLRFRARYNDGFVAYINGQEVARAHAPQMPEWDAAATQMHDDTAVTTYLVANPASVLVTGTNLLAIHAMNASAVDGDFLMAPELSADMAAPSLAGGVGVYLLAATPGQANGEGTAELGPGFEAVTDAAIGVQAGSMLVVTARVTKTLYPIETVRITYRSMFGAETTLALLDDGVAPDVVAGDDRYTGRVPLSGLSPGQMFRWRFTAVDDHAQTSRFPRFADPVDSPEYFGTVTVDESIESFLPVVQWFVEQPLEANNRTGTRGCIWFLDRFYDNIHVSLHGQSTSGGAFPKKSYNVDFNRGDRFTYRDGEKKVKDVDFLTNYADKSKCRNKLAYDFYTETGHPAHFAYPVRIQQNGAFFSVADMVEDGDERYLNRVGLDPDGALYKMYNRCDSSTVGVEKKTRQDEDHSDLEALIAGLDTGNPQREQYLYDNIDIPRAVNYLASHVIVNNRDHGHKNYYLYRDTDGNGEWTILHWDVDLCLGHVWTPTLKYFDDTTYVNDEVVYSRGNRFYDVIYSHPETRAMVVRRIRSLMDTYLKPADTPVAELYFEPRIGQLLELVDPEPGTSDADRDLSRWGSWGNMDDMRAAAARIVDVFLPGRRTWLYGAMSAEHGGEIPNAQIPAVGVAFGQVEYMPVSGNQAEEFVELVNTNAFAVDLSGWSLQGGIAFTFRGGTVMAAGQRLYLSPDVTAFRRRAAVPTGNQGRFVQGDYKGQLSDRGEDLTLRDDSGRIVNTFSYDGFTTDYTGGLRVTEIMYNPSEPESEFVELFNADSHGLDLTDLVLTGGIAFDFRTSRTTYLGPGRYCVVVRNLTAFTNRYGGASSSYVAGVYTGRLDNAGDTLKVADLRRKAIVFECSFDNGRGWPQAAAGGGHSLVPLVIVDQAFGLLDYGRNWRASACLGGSPGAGDPEPEASVMINEIGAHTDTGLDSPYDSDDWIELYNCSHQDVDLGGWYLSDRSDNLKRYRIQPGTVISAHGRLVFTEALHFHTNRTAESGFGLNKAGDELFLSHLPGTANDRIADAVHFKGQVNGESLGRYPDAGTYWHTLVSTPDASNVSPLSHVVISEIMFHPAGTNMVDDTRDEYIELYNPTGENVALANATGGWRIDGGVSYTFASNSVIPGGGTVVLVSFDPATDLAALAAFKAAYGISGFEPVVWGPYVGKLSNTGERLALEAPQDPDRPGDAVSWIIVDEVVYFALWPWPEGARGTGKPFERLPGVDTGNNPESWIVPDHPSPGLGPAKLALITPEYGREFLLPFTTPMRADVDAYQVNGRVHRVEFFEGEQLVAIDEDAPYVQPFTSGTIQTSFMFSARLVDDGGVHTSALSQVSAVGPLSVDNLGASNLTEDAAELWGRFDGCDYVDATLYWGPEDGGTNAGAWANASSIGRLAAQRGFSGTAMSTSITGLSAGHAYVYRWCAERAGSVVWTPVSQRFDTVSYVRWPHRMRIEFSGYHGSETLTNFPLLVRFSTDMPGFAYAGFAYPDARDLRFSNADGDRSLLYEIEEWNTNGVSAVWVRVPALSSGTVIRAYWGNASMTSVPGYRSDGSVWAEGFKAVWHLNGGLADSGAEAFDAFNHGASAGEGVVAGGRLFDGAAAYLEPGIAATWYGGYIENLTLTAWAKPNLKHDGAVMGTAATERDLWLSSVNNGRQALWSFGVGETNYRDAMSVVTRWQYLALSLDRGQATAALDGDVQVFPESYAAFSPAVPLLVGAMNDGAGIRTYFNGAIDEVRVSAVTRSADWLRAEYATVADPAFAAYTVLPADRDGDGMADQWETQHFGNTDALPGGHADSDPLSNGQEYVAGTDPTNAVSVFGIDIVSGLSSPVVRFMARSASGPGYEGLARYYDLEFRSNVVNGPWLPVPGYTAIVGHDQLVTHTNQTDAQLFYRAGVRLE